MGLVQGVHEDSDIGKKSRHATLVETCDGHFPRLGIEVGAPRESSSPTPWVGMDEDTWSWLEFTSSLSLLLK